MDHIHRTVKLLGSSSEERNERLNELLTEAKEKGTFKTLQKWSGEPFPVYGPNREVVLSIERVAAPLFGVVTYAVQFIVYCEKPDGMFIWAARRSPKKWLYPNKLGVTVAGGIPTGESPFECVVRESMEEAGLPLELVRSHARAVGTVNYVTATDTKTTSGGEAGLIRAEVQFLYEMKVDASVVPKPHDMEASDISLYSLEEIKRALDDGEFTPGNACYVLAFFIKHGIVTFENEVNYTAIMSRLHRSLGVHVA